MSQKQFQRVKVIENAGGGLSVSEAAALLQLGERHVQRLKRRYRPDGVAWVQHGNRGRPMPWALPAAKRRTILALARGKISGLQHSHLCEKLHTEEASRSAARPCAASCARSSWLPRRSVAPASTVPAACAVPALA
jgi:transposase